MPPVTPSTRTRPARRWGLVLLCMTVTLGHPHASAQLDRQFDPNTSRGLKYVDPQMADSLLPVQLAGYWGLINHRGFLVFLPRLEWTDFDVDGLVRAVEGGRTGFIRGNGTWGIDPIFEHADRFEEGYAVAGWGGKYGYIDALGRFQLEPVLDGALRFRDGRAAVRRGSRIAFIDRRFGLVTGWTFSAARSYHEGFAAVRLADPHHVELTPPRGQGFAPHQDAAGSDVPRDPPSPPPFGVGDVAMRDRLTQQPGVWAYLDKANKLAFIDHDGGIQELGDFNDGLARFKRGDKWGYLYKNFKQAAPPTFDDARDFTNGLAAVKLDGKWGYVDKAFRVVVRPTYDAADDFDQTLAMVRAGELHGYILRDGRQVIPPQFRDARPFFRGVARVGLGETFAYLNAAGQVFFDPRDAEFGITDVTVQERARRSVRRYRPGNTVLRLPDPRPPLPEPYPAEHLYEELLVAPR